VKKGVEFSQYHTGVTLAENQQFGSLNWRWGALLALLIFAVLVQPVLGPSPKMELLSLAIFEITLIGAIFVSEAQKTLRIVFCLVAGVWFAASFAMLNGANFSGLVILLSTTLTIGTLVITFNNLVRRRENNLNSLMSAVFGFFLLSMSWAFLFFQIERWQPGSFTFVEQGDNWSSLAYFSLVTLTTLGYGDILPISPLARICAGLEAAFGVLYIAVMVGSIVGGYKTSQKAEG
jgi:voltage-gated potassium channel